MMGKGALVYILRKHKNIFPSAQKKPLITALIYSKGFNISKSI